MVNFFKRDTSHPQQRGLYAVHHGDYAGEMLLFIRKNEDSIDFLVIPHNTNRTIPRDKFESGWNLGIIKFVEHLPKDVHKVAVAQFKQNNANTSHRWSESNAPDLLDRKAAR